MPLDLNRFFLKEGADLNFFQAVRLLERLFDGAGRLGTGDDMRSEPLRFETLNSLGFPASEVAAIHPPSSFRRQADELDAPVDHRRDPNWADEPPLPPLADIPAAGKGPLRVSLTFMGLYGVSSPLPSYFVDPITLRKREYFQLKKFLDIFNHRLHSLFYRAWKKYRHPFQFDAREPDPYTSRLLALTGQWPRSRDRSSLGGRDILPGPLPTPLDLRRIPFGRFLGNRVRSARGLQQLLRGYFGFRQVRVRQFVPASVEIPVKTRLGAPESILGRATRLGHHMEDRLSRFIVEIGPLPRPWFDRFLPATTGPSGGTSELPARIRALIDAYLRDPLDYQVKVILEPDADRPPRLGSAHARMGMGAWLGAEPAEEIACLL